jgi:hypothetical protein
MPRMPAPTAALSGRQLVLAVFGNGQAAGRFHCPAGFMMLPRSGARRWSLPRDGLYSRFHRTTFTPRPQTGVAT